MGNQQPAELRCALRKYVSYFVGSFYPRVGLGVNIARLIADLLTGVEKIRAAQVHLSGEFLGIHGVIGAPVIISGHGVSPVPVDLEPVEVEAVQKAFEEIDELQRAVNTIKALRKLR